MNTNRLLAALLLCGISANSWADSLTPAQAFSAGQALANGAQSGAVSNVSSGGVANTVNQFNPTYYSSSGTAPQSTLFQGGNGNTATAGATQVSNCASGPTNPDAFLQQNCNAINLMVNNPSNRPQISIPPSSLATSQAIEANPSTLAANSLGYTDPSAIGAFTGCTNNTSTTPATYTTQVCNQYMGSSGQLCTVGNVVLADANTSYQCDKSKNTSSVPQTCDRTLNVTITQPPPINASYVCQTTEYAYDSSRGGCYSCYPPVEVCGPSACPAGTSPSFFSMMMLDPVTYAVTGFHPVCTPTGSSCPNGMASITAYGPVGKGAARYTACVVPTQNYTCPSGYTLSGNGTGTICVPNPVVSTSTNDGCSVQEAAAQ